MKVAIECCLPVGTPDSAANIIRHGSLFCGREIRMVKEQGFIIIQDMTLLLTIWEFILLPQDPDRPP